MRNLIIYLLLVTFLFQSCYSYQSINLEASKLKIAGKLKITSKLKIGGIYKIKIKEKYVKMKIISCNDTIVKVKIGNSEKEIKISEIKKIQEREFSSKKTAQLVFPIILLSLLYILLKDLRLPY